MGLYENLEEKYYELMERFHLIDVFVRPIEERGVPSFPVAVLIVLLLLAGIGFGVWTLLGGGVTPPGQGEFRITVKSVDGTLVDGALVQVYDANEKIASKTTVKGLAAFDKLPLKTLTVRVTKDGFELFEDELDFTTEKTHVVELVPLAVETPTPEGDDWDFEASPEPEPKDTFDASLDIYVQNYDTSRGINAIVRVYDASNNVQLGDDVVADNGRATMEGLEKGQRVYLMAEADGFLPFDGRGDKHLLKAGNNPIYAKLRKITSTNSTNQSDPYAAALTLVFVRDSAGAGVARANVSVSKAGQTAVLLSGATNANGTASFNISINATESYYALANKTGYFPAWSNYFRAGENATITLVNISNDTIASLAISVVDEKDGKPVASASYGVYRNVMGQELLLCKGATNSNGTASCKNLQRGISVTVRVAKGARNAEDEVVALAGEENEVELTLLLPRGKIVCTAYDAVTNDSISTATFTASFNNASVGSCTGAACEIRVPATVPLNVRIASPDYTSAEIPVTIAANESKPVSVVLFPLSTVNESRVVLQKVIDAATGLEVSSLRLGHSYTFVFTLAANGGEAAGAFFSLGDASVGAITGHLQLGMDNLGGVTNACAPEEVDYAAGKKYAWLDVRYYSEGAGVFTKTILLNVTVSETAALDPRTKRAELPVYYRSYVKKGNAIFRNPFDEKLEARVDSPLESGCFARTVEASYDVYSPSTTCQRGACVTLEFSQNGRNGPNEGFTAQSFLNMLDGADVEPLVVKYKIEVFDDLREHSLIAVKWSDSNAAELVKVSTPLQQRDPVNKGTWICGGSTDYWFPGTSDDVRQSEIAAYEDGTGFVLNLDALRKCSNYAPPKRTGKPFVARGAIYLKPLENRSRVDLSARFASGSRVPPFWAIALPPIAVNGNVEPAPTTPPSRVEPPVALDWFKHEITSAEVESFVSEAQPTESGCYCEAVYSPVCGADGKTYGNACEAKCAAASVSYQGQCVKKGAECALKCAKKLALACAADAKKVYYNDCFAACDDAASASPGVCGACPDYYEPVCGSDDKTYFNDCAAKHAGVSVKFRAACKTGFHEFLFANHSTWFRVQSNATRATDYAIVELQFEQKNKADNSSLKDVGRGVFQAESIEDCFECPNGAASCPDSARVIRDDCPYAPVRVHFRLTVRKNRNDNSLFLTTTPDFLKLKEGGAWIFIGKEKTPKIVTDWFNEGFSVELGSLAKGTVVEGVAVAYPLKQGHSPVEFGHVMNDARDPNSPFESSVERSVFVSTKPGAPTTEFEEWSTQNIKIPGDNCFGFVGVSFDPSFSADKSLYFQSGCNTLGMRVTPIFPGDGVPTKVDVPQGVSLVVKVEGGNADSQGCYESCDYDEASKEVGACKPGFEALTKKGAHVLRYNSEASGCPDKYKVLANKIDGSTINLSIAPVGSGYKRSLQVTVRGAENIPCTPFYVNPAVAQPPVSAQSVKLASCEPSSICKANGNACEYKRDSAGKPLTTNPLNDYTKLRSLFIAPLMSNWEYEKNTLGSFSTQFRYPQLWVVVNHKQYGARDVVIVERGDDANIAQYASEGNTLNLPIVHFDGPGLKIFSYTKRTPARTEDNVGRRMVAYERRQVIYYDGQPPEAYGESKKLIQYLTPVSEYTLTALGENITDVSDRNLIDYVTDKNMVFPDGTKLADAITSKSTFNDNAYYDTEIVESMIGRAQRAASLAAYWRSMALTMYCDKDPASVTLDDFIDDNACKESADGWRYFDSNITQKASGCTFCNNTFSGPLNTPSADTPFYNDCDLPLEEQIANGFTPCTYNTAIPIFQCDQRCLKAPTEEGEPQVGLATIDYGAEYNGGTCSLEASGIASGIREVTVAQITACKEKAGGCPLLLDGDVPQCFNDVYPDGFLTNDDYLSGDPAVVPAKPDDASDPTKYSCPTDEVPESTLIAVNDYCQAVCDNWCTPRTEETGCTPGCSQEGVTYEYVENVSTQTDWLNESGPVRAITLMSTNSWRAPEHAPFVYFRDYKEPQVKYHFAVNTINKDDSFEELNTILTTNAKGDLVATGCDDDKHVRTKEQGIFEVKEENDLELYATTGQEQWHGYASVLTLEQSGANPWTLGTRCKKADWKTELCSPLFDDYNDWNSAAKTGACLNSVYQYEEAPEAPLLSDLPFKGRNYFFNVQGKGVWISPQGYIVMLGANKSKDESNALYTYYDQVFHYWYPDGKYGGSFQPTWKFYAKTKAAITGVVVGAVVAVTICAGTFGFGCGPGAYTAAVVGAAVAGAALGYLAVTQGGDWMSAYAVFIGLGKAVLSLAAMMAPIPFGLINCAMAPLLDWGSGGDVVNLRTAGSTVACMATVGIGWGISKINIQKGAFKFLLNSVGTAAVSLGAEKALSSATKALSKYTAENVVKQNDALVQTASEASKKFTDAVKARGVKQQVLRNLENTPVASLNEVQRAEHNDLLVAARENYDAAVGEVNSAEAAAASAQNAVQTAADGGAVFSVKPEGLEGGDAAQVNWGGDKKLYATQKGRDANYKTEGLNADQVSASETKLVKRKLPSALGFALAALDGVFEGFQTYNALSAQRVKLMGTDCATFGNDQGAEKRRLVIEYHGLPSDVQIVGCKEEGWTICKADNCPMLKCTFEKPDWWGETTGEQEVTGSCLAVCGENSEEKQPIGKGCEEGFVCCGPKPPNATAEPSTEP